MIKFTVPLCTAARQLRSVLCAACWRRPPPPPFFLLLLFFLWHGSFRAQNYLGGLECIPKRVPPQTPVAAWERQRMAAAPACFSCRRCRHCRR